MIPAAETTKQRKHDIERLLQDPAVLSDSKQLKSLSQELIELEPRIAIIADLESIEKQLVESFY